MKKSGIIRRLDELGRIVIPKEIRKTLHIKEGTPLDINVQDGEFIILRKYSPIKELGTQAQICAEVLFEQIQQPVIVTDLDKVVACCGIKCESCPLSEKYLKLLNKRNICKIEEFNESVFTNENAIHKDILFSPIIVEGDILGSIVILYNNYTEQLLSNLKLATNFISKLTY